MPISFACECGKLLKAKDEWAGRGFKCPGCGKPLVVPTPAPPEPPPEPEPEEETYGVADEPPPPPEPTTPPKSKRRGPVLSSDVVSYSADRYKDILAEKPARPMRDHAYWILLLALVPLLFALVGKDDESILDRLKRTVANAPPDVHHRIDSVLGSESDDDANDVLDRLMAALPGGRLDGAHLPRSTFVHFIYAVLAATGFFALGFFLVPPTDGKPGMLLLIGLFTGTIGVLLLLFAQFLASVTQGRILISRNPIILGLFWIAWAIGFSYSVARDPTSGFLVSFLGYTFGVGLCEEVCKAIPLIAYYRGAERPQWRLAWAWGFASGVGFGVAEGILYSANYYNGIAPGSTYLVRFVSCVALHAVWSAAVALFLDKHQNIIHEADGWLDFIPRILFIVSVPMILHGLYDTALKKDHTMIALVTALASFGWLAWCLERARSTTERPARKARAKFA